MIVKFQNIKDQEILIPDEIVYSEFVSKLKQKCDAGVLAKFLKWLSLFISHN